MSERKADEISNAQRGLWTFLLYTLAGPLFGAIAATALLAAAILQGVAPGPIGAVPPEQAWPQLGMVFTAAFVWCAVPATLTGLGSLLFVLPTGTLPWLAAVVLGVACFGATVVFLPFPFDSFLPYLAFTAGVVSLICRNLLVSRGILVG